MVQIVKIVAILTFVVVFVAVTYFITVKIFNRLVGNITQQQTENITKDIIGSLTGGSQKVEKEPCNVPKHQKEFKSEPYYSGPLIDSHVHLPTTAKIVSSVAGQNGLELPVLEGDLSASNLICLFESEGITKIFGFHITSKFAEGAGVSAARVIEESYPGKIVHFIMPPPVLSLNVAPSGIEGILNNNKGLFKGFGEIGLYMDGYQGTLPNDSMLKEIYKLAQEHNLIVMIHPEDNLRDGVEEILQEFPNVTFFFHGGKYQEWLIDLMPKYKNFYYSIDADISHIYGFKAEHEFQKLSNKEEYLSYMRENFDKVLDEEVRNWKARIEKYPDRFTWGSDRWFAWHFDPEVGGIIEEFSRSFIGRLRTAIQENFAYKNAERMLQ